MRSYTLIASLALLAGCSGGQDLSGTEAPGNDAIGAVTQKSQFADNTIINLVDTLSATVTLTTDVNPVTVQIYYVGDKTTDTTHTAAAPVLVSTVNVPAEATVEHDVNLLNSAFAGGYGTILLQSTAETDQSVFQTYVQYGGALFSTGGSVFTGGSYRVPYLNGTLRVVMVVTSQSDYPFEIDFSNLSSTDFRSVTLPPLSTYKFDTLTEGWHLNGTSAIQVTTNASGTVALSGYIDRFLQPRVRLAPVKAAPFP